MRWVGVGIFGGGGAFSLGRGRAYRCTQLVDALLESLDLEFAAVGNLGGDVLLEHLYPLLHLLVKLREGRGRAGRREGRASVA